MHLRPRLASLAVHRQCSIASCTASVGEPWQQDSQQKHGCQQHRTPAALHDRCSRLHAEATRPAAESAAADRPGRQCCCPGHCVGTAAAAVHPTWAPLAPLAIGAATAGLGAAYAAALRASLRVVWRGLPAQPWLVPAITTAGGVAVGGVAIAGGGFFGVGNYVAAARGAAPWPRARAVGPLLAASLLTTAAGLSVGPEAPMVAAGAVCGAALARRYRLDEREAAFAGAAGALTAFLGFPSSRRRLRPRARDAGRRHGRRPGADGAGDHRRGPRRLAPQGRHHWGPFPLGRRRTLAARAPAFSRAAWV